MAACQAFAGPTQPFSPSSNCLAACLDPERRPTGSTAVVVLGLVTFGIGFLGLAAWILCGPVDLAIQAICGALGAWLYGRLGGANDEWGNTAY